MKAAARKPAKAAPPAAKPKKPAARRKVSPKWYAELRKTFRPGIERDTELMPWLIADSIITEVARWLDLDTSLPADWSDWLDRRAERCYAKSAHFHKLLHRRGNGGRDTLYAFMRHWLAAKMMKEAPALARRMPPEFANGIACGLGILSPNVCGVATKKKQ